MPHPASVLDLGQGLSREALIEGLEVLQDALRRLNLSAKPAQLRVVHQSRPDICAKVRTSLATATLERPTLTAVADELHISERTLKRWLQQEGTSFRQLLDECLSRRSRQLLVEPGVTLESVAEVLGYSSAANFSRAFRRWSGTTPGEQRAALSRNMRDSTLQTYSSGSRG